MTTVAELKQVRQDLTAGRAGNVRVPWLVATIRAFGVPKLLAALALCVGGTSWADGFVVPYIGTVIYAYCSPFDPVCQPPQQYGWAPVLTFETVSGADGTYAGSFYDPDGVNTLLHATLSSDFAFIPALDTAGHPDTGGQLYWSLSATVVGGLVTSFDGFAGDDFDRWTFSGSTVAYDLSCTKCPLVGGSAVVVPEPSTYALVLVGLLLLQVRLARARGARPLH
jgi:hypothetical protein